MSSGRDCDARSTSACLAGKTAGYDGDTPKLHIGLLHAFVGEPAAIGPHPGSSGL